MILVISSTQNAQFSMDLSSSKMRFVFERKGQETGCAVRKISV